MSLSVFGAIYSQGATYSLAVASIDDTPGNLTPTYGLADPLIMKQGLPSDPRGLMAHPVPAELQFSLIAPDATTYANLALGDEVVLAPYNLASFGGTGTNAFFGGRIATLDAAPHDLGIIYTVGCVDYLADLAERPVGLVSYAQQWARTRVNQVMDEAGLPRPADIGPAAYLGAPGPYLVARSVSPTDALSLILEALDNMAGETATADENGAAVTDPFPQPIPGFQYRPYLVPVMAAALPGDPTGRQDPSQPFAVRWAAPWTKRIRMNLPMRLTNVAGTYRVTVSTAQDSPATGSRIVDGGNVARDSVFVQDKSAAQANRTIATNPAGGAYTWDWLSVQQTTGWTSPVGAQSYTGQLDGPVVLQTIDTQEAPSPPNALPTPQEQAWAYRLPFRPDSRASWSPTTLTWEAWNEPGVWRLPNLTDQFTVTRAQTSRMPGGREWVTGAVTATQLTISKGRVTITVQLSPHAFNYALHAWAQGASLGVVRLDSPVVATVTLAQLSTRDSLADWQLVRGS